MAQALTHRGNVQPATCDNRSRASVSPLRGRVHGEIIHEGRGLNIQKSLVAPGVLELNDRVRVGSRRRSIKPEHGNARNYFFVGLLMLIAVSI